MGALPFPDKSFDRVVCQFGVMFFSDKQGAFREALRVLRPGGEFLFNVWGRREGTPYQVEADIIGRLLGREPSSLLPPAYSDTETIISDITAAGFGKPVVKELNKSFLSASARDAAIALCGGGLARHHIGAGSHRGNHRRCCSRHRCPLRGRRDRRPAASDLRCLHPRRGHREQPMRSNLTGG